MPELYCVKKCFSILGNELNEFSQPDVLACIGIGDNVSMFCLMPRAYSYGENSPVSDSFYALAQLSRGRSCLALLFPEMGMAESFPLGGSRTGAVSQCSVM